MAFQFPWTNFHELNLDWFLSKFKQFTDNFLGTTATAESVPYGTQPSVTVTGGELDDDTDITDPFTFNFKIPAGKPGEQGEQGVQGVPGQDGFSPIATVTKTGTVATITITDANGTTTTTISDGEVTQDQLDTKAPAILPTVSGSIANFSDGADDLPMSELIIDIEPNQSGSGDPAPDNIRPISGWTGANVTRTGKNLFPIQIAPVNGWALDRQDMVAFMNTLKAGTYALTCVNEIQSVSAGQTANEFILGVWLRNSALGYQGPLECRTTITSSQEVAGFSVTSTKTITITEAMVGNFNHFYLYSGDNKNNATSSFDIQLEVGATATTYEPYITPGTLSISWQTEAGTVYGGTLDVKTGVLTVTHGIVDLGTLNYGYNSAYGFYVRRESSLLPASAKAFATDTIASAVCTSFKTETYANTVSGNYPLSIGIGLSFIAISDTRYTDVATFKTAMNGVILCYELATPQTYQLTPQQLFNTLYGVNNVWSDTGDSTVTYTADTKLYIEQLTQPAKDDMVANTTIPNGKFFMIGNNLYRATTAIASGSQIIPGTNATPMSLADALNLFI